MKKSLIFLLLLVGCSAPEKIYKVEDGLQPYVDNFFNISMQYDKIFQKDNLIIKLTHDLVHLKNGLGVTTLHYVGGRLGQRTIEFDYDYWMKATESQRQTLSIHEFGHAYLYRVHNSGYSIMNPIYSRSGWPNCSSYIDSCHKFLLNELFKNQ